MEIWFKGCFHWPRTIICVTTYYVTTKKVRWFKIPFKTISSKNNYFTPSYWLQNENEDYEININKHQDVIMNVEHKISPSRIIRYFNNTRSTISEQKVVPPELDKLIKYLYQPLFFHPHKTKKNRCLKFSKNVGFHNVFTPATPRWVVRRLGPGPPQ